MTKREVLSLALKLTGVILLVYTIVGLPLSIESIHIYASGQVPGVRSGGLYTALSILAIVLYFASALVLIGYADGIAQRLIRTDREIPLSDAKGWQKPAFGIAVRIVGVVLIAYALPALVYVLAESYVEAKGLTGEASGLAQAFARSALEKRWVNLLDPALRILIGCYLLFGARQFTRLVLRGRSEAQDA